MVKTIRGGGVVATSLVLVLLTAGVARAAPQRSVVQRFSDGSVVPGAWSSLTTNAAGASLTLDTTELPAGHVVTVWWVIFNHPEGCSHGEGPYRCGPGDLPPFGGNDSALTSLVYATGHMIGGSGAGGYGAHLAVGDTRDAIWGPGLVNPLGADIHLVVHDHGPVDPQDRAQAIHDFGTCNPSCTDLQFSVHEQ